ncbi:unnamed protein product [Caenorhabditis bovis]|uniref:Pyroglutamyl-peptidase I n=1 Tax=Caenorhabditis bovis TaxID=2654633 RepID=A0A8S1FBJ6_9PELO|nr:unnamed protein product [Caenorhabditis bovis]
MPTVILTGFGPFRNFTTNPSSEIVKELQKNGIPGINLEAKIMRVAYAEVKNDLEVYWNLFQPELVVHLGAHEVANTIKIEKQAFAAGYEACDVEGCTPDSNSTGCCRPESVLCTELDCDRICETVRQSCSLDESCINLTTSDDPGRYLCGFSYFLSLNEDPKKALFVHVPPFTEECTKEKVTEVIREIILRALDKSDNKPT